MAEEHVPRNEKVKGHSNKREGEEDVEETTSANEEMDREFAHHQSDITSEEPVSGESTEDSDAEIEREEASEHNAEKKADDVIDDGRLRL